MPRWIMAAQGSDVWLAARVGVLTASRMADVMGTAARRQKLALAIACERMTGRAEEVHVTQAMRHGQEYEAAARERYEEVTGRLVVACGLAMHDGIYYFGASPDGLVGEDGLVEIKCPTPTTYMAWRISGEVPPEHKPQMLAQLCVTGRAWCDFVAFHPHYPSGSNIYIRRFEPALEEVEACAEAAREFLAEVEGNIIKSQQQSNLTEEGQ